MVGSEQIPAFTPVHRVITADGRRGLLYTGPFQRAELHNFRPGGTVEIDKITARTDDPNAEVVDIYMEGGEIVWSHQNGTIEPAILRVPATPELLREGFVAIGARIDLGEGMQTEGRITEIITTRPLPRTKEIFHQTSFFDQPTNIVNFPARLENLAAD